jgi:hypothetical protein
MQALSTAHITLTSNPHKKRVGLIPLCTGLALGWAFVLLWMIIAIVAVWESAYQASYEIHETFIWSMLVLGTSSTFAVCLGLMTFGLLRDCNRDYVLELTESEVVLVVIDKLRKRRGTQMVLLDDVSYAEYYPYPDSASIILHTAYADMEVPLWPMSNQGRDVVDYLDGRGVRVVNVQSDDQIPAEPSDTLRDL